MVVDEVALVEEGDILLVGEDSLSLDRPGLSSISWISLIIGWNAAVALLLYSTTLADERRQLSVDTKNL